MSTLFGAITPLYVRFGVKWNLTTLSQLFQMQQDSQLSEGDSPTYEVLVYDSKQGRLKPKRTTHLIECHQLKPQETCFNVRLSNGTRMVASKDVSISLARKDRERYDARKFNLHGGYLEPSDPAMVRVCSLKAGDFATTPYENELHHPQQILEKKTLHRLYPVLIQSVKEQSIASNQQDGGMFTLPLSNELILLNNGVLVASVETK